jgi:hypothetical protein
MLLNTIWYSSIDYVSSEVCNITLLARLLYLVIIRITFSQHVMVSHTATPRWRAPRRCGAHPSDVSRYLYCGRRLRFFVARHLAFTSHRCTDPFYQVINHRTFPQHVMVAF